jgi:hypothetical protein
LLFFVVLIAPGLAYDLAREQREPRRDVSALRELAVLILVGLLCDILVSILFVIAKGLLESSTQIATPDVPALLANPHAYVVAHTSVAFYWGLAWLAAACGLGYSLGAADDEGWIRKSLNRVSPGGPIQFVSSWTMAFHADKGVRVYVACTLDDGSWIAGYLAYHNVSPEETEDRDLMLTGPVAYRESGGTSETELADVGYAVVSARRIVHMEVYYMPERAGGESEEVTAR